MVNLGHRQVVRDGVSGKRGRLERKGGGRDREEEEVRSAEEGNHCSRC